jgi:hypothetical protein
MARKHAASLIGRGYSLEQTAQTTGVPQALLGDWMEHDAEFQFKVLRAEVRLLKRQTRRAQSAIQRAANSDR